MSLRRMITVGAALFTTAVMWCGMAAGQGPGAEGTKVVLLGTGTPRPVPERSGPATAIVVGERAYLVDFGPGVVRRAAAAAERDMPALEPVKLKVAFVTHLHSDHTAGYPDLILTPWVMGRTELNVYGPEGLEEMTGHVLQAWRRDIEIRTTSLEQRGPLVVHAHDVKPGVAYKDDKVTVTAFPVPHGAWAPNAFGYRFDTCHGCDLLIHETYSPTMKVPVMADWPKYSAKYHTSTMELAEIANRAKPKLLIVYHQSGRVPDEQIKAEIEKGYSGKFVVGKDLEVY
jgi:ribonuclease BN (tRNA processing enzyme)